MLQTKIDVPQDTRTKLIAILQARLADAIDLQLQTKQAHWNVRGPSFIALHELFDKVYDEAEDWVDLLAERIGILGGQAMGRVHDVAQASSLPKYPADIYEGPKHVQALSTAIAAFGKNIRTAIEQVSEMGDPTTEDLLTEVSRGADKQLWFVEAHLQA